jgi:hypothetical protein
MKKVGCKAVIRGTHTSNNCKEAKAGWTRSAGRESCWSFLIVRIARCRQVAQNPILVLLQCLLLALYLILLSVLYLIQLGRALFFLIMWPILTFLRNVLMEPISILYLYLFNNKLNTKHVKILNHFNQNTRFLRCASATAFAFCRARILSIYPWSSSSSCFSSLFYVMRALHLIFNLPQSPHPCAPSSTSWSSIETIFGGVGCLYLGKLSMPEMLL